MESGGMRYPLRHEPVQSEPLAAKIAILRGEFQDFCRAAQQNEDIVLTDEEIDNIIMHYLIIKDPNQITVEEIFRILWVFDCEKMSRPSR